MHGCPDIGQPGHSLGGQGLVVDTHLIDQAFEVAVSPGAAAADVKINAFDIDERICPIDPGRQNFLPETRGQWPVQAKSPFVHLT